MIVVPGTGGKFPRWPAVNPVADVARGLFVNMDLPMGLLGYLCHGCGLKSKLRREEERMREWWK